MPRDNSNLLPFDSRIDKTDRRNLRGQTNPTGEMVEEVAPKAIQDYFQPILSKNQPRIANVPINVNNFKLKLGLIQRHESLLFEDVPSRTLTSTFNLS